MRFLCLRLLWGVALLLGGLWLAPAAADPGPPSPAPPAIQEVTKAPATARVLRQVALKYEAKMTPAAREQDFLAKVKLAKDHLGVRQLKELRRQTMDLLFPGREVSWEDLRRRRWPRGDQVGVTLSAPVWVPAQSKRVVTYCGFEKKWQDVAHMLPRPSGYVWHAANMKDINDKAHYRAERIQFECNSKFAPLAALLLEYIFREGWYEPDKRVPLLVVRGGEDTYAAPAFGGPITAECLSFPDEETANMSAQVALCRFSSLADIYHGRHAPQSNHRLGLALDLNDFNYRGQGVMDGSPNPISHAARQFDRNAMHKADARNLPAWVYRAAKAFGMRIPQEWTYFGYNTDWQHVDVGTLKDRGQGKGNRE
ncbi:MAG: hypothetical protein FJ134_05485 [Deltaproteobacteria bacterium]|nr:hypothetical protein [Deltaproteobacteria bacterium]